MLSGHPYGRDSWVTHQVSIRFLQRMLSGHAGGIGCKRAKSQSASFSGCCPDSASGCQSAAGVSIRFLQRMLSGLVTMCLMLDMQHESQSASFSGCCPDMLKGVAANTVQSQSASFSGCCPDRGRVPNRGWHLSQSASFSGCCPDSEINAMIHLHVSIRFLQRMLSGRLRL